MSADQESYVEARLSPASISVGEAATAYLDTLRVSTTRRVYTLTLDKTAAVLGPHRALADVEAHDVDAALEALWGNAAVSTWNSQRSAVSSWLKWCRQSGHPAPAVSASSRRQTEPPVPRMTWIRSRAAIDDLTSHSDVPLREVTLWRMLYETAAPARELLGINIEDVDLVGRSALVRAFAAHRRRPADSSDGDVVFRRVRWGAGTGRLLGRYLQSRTAGPVFVATQPPHRARLLTERDVDPETGFARLTPATASHWLDEYTAPAGRGTGWTLRELRESARLHIRIDQAIDAVDQAWRVIGGARPDLVLPVTEHALDAVAMAARELAKSDDALACTGLPLSEAVSKIMRAVVRAAPGPHTPTDLKEIRSELARASALAQAQAVVAHVALSR